MRTLTVGITLLFLSCGKNYQDPAIVSVTIDGKTQQSSHIFGTSDGVEFTLDGHFFNRNETSLLHIVLLTDIKVGQPDAFQNSSVAYTTKDGITYSGDAVYGGHGTLTVAFLDSTTRWISGIFEGVFYNVAGGSDSITITNGRWDAWYTSF